MHGLERASLLSGEPGDVFYKTAADQPSVRHRPVWRPHWTYDDTRGAVAGEPGDVVMTRAGLA
jgi:hypothetical protein